MNRVEYIANQLPTQDIAPQLTMLPEVRIPAACTPAAVDLATVGLGMVGIGYFAAKAYYHDNGHFDAVEDQVCLTGDQVPTVSGLIQIRRVALVD